MSAKGKAAARAKLKREKGRIKVFLIVEDGTAEPELFVMSTDDASCGKIGGCMARVYLPPVPYEPGVTKCPDLNDPSLPWPTKCDDCGRVIKDWLRSSGLAPIYKRADTGEILGPIRRGKIPPGAAWFHTLYPPEWQGPDGRTLTIMLPGGHEWSVDTRASNCKMPDDTEHRCWCRHGNVEDGTITIDKKGKTCKAGAGSIKVPGYHGHLRDGYLVEC